jgi:cytochrome b
MKTMTKWYVKMTNKANQYVCNERGSQTLEWIGIAAVVVICVGLISTAFSGDTTFGKKVLDKFTGFIDKIGG